MNKLYGLLAAAVICSVANGLVASEGPKKSFFDQNTQDVLKRTARVYAFGYAGIYGVGTGLAVLGTSLVTPFMIAWSLGTKDEKMFGAVMNPSATIKGLNREIWKSITRSIPVTLPLVLGSTLAYHKYQENIREKNAA